MNPTATATQVPPGTPITINNYNAPADKKDDKKDDKGPSPTEVLAGLCLGALHLYAFSVITNDWPHTHQAATLGAVAGGVLGAVQVWRGNSTTLADKVCKAMSKGGKGAFVAVALLETGLPAYAAKNGLTHSYAMFRMFLLALDGVAHLGGRFAAPTKTDDVKRS